MRQVSILLFVVNFVSLQLFQISSAGQDRIAHYLFRP